MKKLTLILFICIPLLVSAQAEYEKTSINQTENSLKVISSSDTEVTIELSIGSYLKRPVKIKGETFYSINLDGESWIKQKGDPELPKISKSIMIPGNTGFNAKVISSKYIDVKLPVTPSKGILSRAIDPNDIPFTFSDTYSKDKFFPSNNVSFGEPYLIRETRGVAVNFYPMMYNPIKKTLRVYKSLTVQISFEGTNLKNTTSRTPAIPNKYFAPIIKNHFINYSQAESSINTKTVEENGKMLIICYNSFMDEMQSFVNHKNNKGLETELVSMNSVGSTASDVDSYIQNKYNSDNSLTFVLLVGDNAQIPTLTVSGGGSDPSFSLVSGSDYYPDIIIGRFSAETESQVETMVARSINYENMDEQSWFHEGIGIASSQGTGDDGEYDYEHVRNIRTDLLAWHYSQVGEFYDGSQGGNDASGNPTPAIISSAINSGVSIINYTGHGSTTSWSTSGFSNTNVNSLTNENKLPFIFSVACVNGNFTNNTCFAETWLRATNNSNPTGAIGFYGSSINQAWSPPMQAQDEFNSLLIDEDYVTFGALCYNASCSMMDSYGSGATSSGTNMFLTWHIFGDPSISVIPNIQDCQENITITAPISGGTHEFLASNSISASNQITNGAVVHYGAGSIKLLPGFSVAAGCHFTADANGCDRSLLKSTTLPMYYTEQSDNYKSEVEEGSTNMEVTEIGAKSPTVQVFPNPVFNGVIQLRINSSDTPNSIAIFDLMGNMVYANQNPDKYMTINNISEKGLLFIKVEFENSVIVKKIISE